MKFTKKSVVLDSSKKISNPIDSHVIRIKSKFYKNYSLTDLRDCVLGWVLKKDKKDMKGYCKICKIPRSTLQYYLKEIPHLTELMSKDELDLMTAENIFGYIKKKELKRKSQLG